MLMEGLGWHRLYWIVLHWIAFNWSEMSWILWHRHGIEIELHWIQMRVLIEFAWMDWIGVDKIWLTWIVWIELEFISIVFISNCNWIAIELTSLEVNWSGRLTWVDLACIELDWIDLNCADVNSAGFDGLGRSGFTLE